MKHLKTTSFLPLLALLALALTFGQKAQAQIMEPVEWEFESVATEEGTYELLFTANVDKGWYIYSQDLEDGGPIPTTFEFDEGNTYALKQEIVEKGEVIEKFDEMFDMDIKKYAKQVVFVATVKAKPGTEISGYLTFKTCDDMRCLPPEDVDFEFTLK